MCQLLLEIEDLQSYCSFLFKIGFVAQLAEHRAFNSMARGSSPLELNKMSQSFALVATGALMSVF